MSARIDMELPELDDDAQILQHFQYWLDIRFGFHSNQGWASLISDNYRDISKTSIGAFYILFDEYTELLKQTTFREIKKQERSLVFLVLIV